MSSEFESERPSKIRKLNVDAEPGQSSEAIESTSDLPPSGSALKTEARPEPAKPTENMDPANDNDIPDAAIEKERNDSPPTTKLNPTEPPLSKSQLKKQRRKEEWEAGRDARKLIRKEKRTARKERKREERREERRAEISSNTSYDPTDFSAHPRRSQAGPKTPHHQLPVTIVLDCSWDSLMSDKEIVSLANQVTRCYSDNNKATNRAHLVVSSFDGRLRERFEGLLGGQYKTWRNTRFSTDDFVGVSEAAKTWMADEITGGVLEGQFRSTNSQQTERADLVDQGEVIYLSSDSDTTLTELKPFSTYIIGGLVDKNRHKGICHRRAGEKGIQTAKLPIGEYMQMASRYVLAVNHVNEIMLKWLELGDWGRAFEAVMPKRKGGVLKVKKGEGVAGDGGEHGADGDGENDGENDGEEGSLEEGDLEEDGLQNAGSDARTLDGEET